MKFPCGPIAIRKATQAGCPSNNLRPAQHLNRRYLAAFLSITVLLILNQLLIQPSLLRLQADASVINEAGRQRMLSQRLVKLALLLPSMADDGTFRARSREFREVAETWDRTHVALTGGATEWFDASPEDRKNIRQILLQIAPYYSEMRSGIKEIEEAFGAASVETLDSHQLKSGTVRLLQNEDLFLRHMDELVQSYERVAQSRVNHLRHVGWGLTSSALLVLIYVGAFLLRPASQVIDRQFWEIEQSRAELEHRVQTRTREIVDMHKRLRHEMEERVRLLNELGVSARFNTVADIANGLAHELNQPLGAIGNFAETGQALLMSGRNDCNAIRTIFERISAASLRGGAIVRRLRNLVRQQPAEHVPVDVNQLVKEICDLCAHEARQARAEIQLELSPTIPRVLADRAQIQHTVLNLLCNRLRAFAEDEHAKRQISVKTEIGTDGFVVVSIHGRPGRMDSDQAEIAFQPGLNEHVDRIGMSLAISRSIVEHHGGRLWLESHDPAAAPTFHFTLLPEGQHAT